MSICNEFDVNNVCRTCLISENLTPLYDYNYKHTQYIDKILMMCTLIKCHKNDGLPNQICSDCITEIKRSHKFALKCEQSQNRLRKYLSNDKHRSHYSNINYESTKSLEDPLKMSESQNVIVQELVLIKSEIDDQVESSDVIKNELVVIKNELKLDIETEPNDLMAESFDMNEIKCEYNNDTEEMEEDQPEFREMPTLIDSNLNSHHRKKKSINRFSCSVCNSKFKSGANLQVHLRSHTGERPYSCTQMDTGKKLYSCTFCDKTFHRKAMCNDHINLHKYLMRNPEKPFLCTVCNGSFPVKANLVKHMQTHTEKKRFKCSVCSVSFSRLQQIQNHLLTHVEDTPYSQIYIQRIRTEES